MDERKELVKAIYYLDAAKHKMVNAFSFDQLCTGHGNDLYGEAIDRLIKGIKVYLNKDNGT